MNLLNKSLAIISQLIFSHRYEQVMSKYDISMKIYILFSKRTALISCSSLFSMIVPVRMSS